MKYIVKNCPAYQKELITMDFKTGETKATDKNYCMNPFLPNKCQDCTDCVIKQVIEKCKGAVSDYSNLEILRTACGRKTVSKSGRAKQRAAKGLQ